MSARKSFLSKHARKSIAGFAMVVFLVLTLFLTFPAIDTPLVSETYAAAQHTVTVTVCSLGVCVTVTYTEYHDHTT